jgi:hypothetical protein
MTQRVVDMETNKVIFQAELVMNICHATVTSSHFVFIDTSNVMWRVDRTTLEVVLLRMINGDVDYLDDVTLTYHDAAHVRVLDTSTLETIFTYYVLVRSYLALR